MSSHDESTAVLSVQHLSPSSAPVSSTIRALQSELEKFYKNYDNIKTVVDLVVRKERGPISLRLLDYFVVNYAVEYAVAYPHPSTGIEYDVGKAYELQMKVYHKQLFDPFRRGSRSMIILHYMDNDGVQQQFTTTLAQLNFFKWLIENHILDYIEQNRDVIVEKMKEHNGPRTANSEKPQESDDASQSESFELAVGYVPSRGGAARRKLRVGGERKVKSLSSINTRTVDVSARRTPLNGRRSYLVKF